MPEWWTYSLSDFLMFSPRTWGRLLAGYHAQMWPAGQAVALLGGVALLALAAGRAVWRARVACLLLAAAWLWTAWAFHWERFAEVNWAAQYYAWAFALQAGLLVAATPWANQPVPANNTRRAGLALLALAVLLYPLWDRLMGRPWEHTQWFGLMPDPTVLATLGIWLAWPGRPAGGLHAVLPVIPLLWCAVSGATAWTLGLPDAALLPVAGLAAAGCAWFRRRR